MLPELICGTPFHALPAPVPLEQPVPPGPAKLERDAFGDFNMVVTENFAVKYGPNFSQDRAERIAGWFEASWEAELNTLGHTHPVGSDTYLFNVYIGDTGGGIPSAAGNSGYFYVDSQNQPYIVYGRNTDEQTEFGEVVAAHEFHHAIQWAEDRYDYSGVGAWYWEASGNWAPYVVFPDNAYFSISFYAYAFLPHYPVNFFDYPDQGLLQEAYQYGSSLFLHHLSTVTADDALIVDSWQTGSSDDPLKTLDDLLQARGTSLDEAFIDHIGRNATWDYPTGANITWMLDYYADYFDESQNMVLGPIDDFGEWSPPSALAPMRYGYNVVEVDLDGAWQLELEGLDDATYVAVLVQDGERLTVWPGETARVEGPAFVSVGVWTEHGDTSWDVAVYPYTLHITDPSLQVDDTGAPLDTGDPASPEVTPTVPGCGCTTGASPLGAVALMGLALARRR